MPKVSLKSFIEFARTKPTDEDFDPASTEECAIAQFAKSYLGHDHVSAGTHYFHDFHDMAKGSFTIDVPNWEVLWSAVWDTSNWGALTARLEALENAH